MAREDWTYRDLAPLVRAVGVAVGIQIACNILSVASSALAYQERAMLAAQNLTLEQISDQMAATELRDAALAFLAFIVIVVAGIMVLRSIYRANKNLHARNVPGLEYTPGWCVGWFFVPVAALWKPYQAVKEIWMASTDPVHQSVDRPGIFPVWWTLFIISNITGTSSARLAFSAKDVGTQQLSDLLGIISTVVSIPEAVLIVIILRQIAAAQTRTIGAGPLQIAPVETF
jgi:hypothetical protein